MIVKMVYLKTSSISLYKSSVFVAAEGIIKDECTESKLTGWYFLRYSRALVSERLAPAKKVVGFFIG